MGTISKDIKAEIKQLQSLKKNCLVEIKHLPAGRLQHTTVKGKDYYRVSNGSESKYLGSNDEMITDLKKRHFYTEYCKVIMHNLKILQGALRDLYNDDPEAIKSRFPRKYLDVPPECYSKLGITVPDSKQHHQTSSYYSEALKHISSSGIPMRSKSEVSIADLYTSFGIKPYYEKLLELPDGNTLLPDFTIIIDGGRKTIYHEHIGMTSNAEYMQSFYQKLCLYMKNGLIPFRDVFFTFDEPDGSLDLSAIKRMIAYYI